VLCRRILFAPQYILEERLIGIAAGLLQKIKGYEVFPHEFGPFRRIKFDDWADYILNKRV
jgi:hypothetical protein